MSKLDGGIFSNPSGKTAGIVFGAARTRQGKRVTARQLVSPSNPNTAAQQTQRGKFSDSLAIVRFNGAEIYQSDFNRAISQLPGFQSQMSIYMSAMDASKTLSLPPSINLGTLHYPDTITVASDDPGVITTNFSVEPGDNGTASDQVITFAVDVTSAGRSVLIGGKNYGVVNRADDTDEISGLTSGQTYLVGVYFKGAGDSLGMLSQCLWYMVTVS